MNAARHTQVDEIGDPAAPPGSRAWAVHVRRELQHALKQYEFDHRHVENLLTAMREHDGFRELEDRRGRRFKDFEAFCVEPYPWGLGYKSDAINRIIAERKEKTTQQRAENPPTLLDTGRPGKSSEKGSDNPPLPKGSTSADRLTARIARDHPDVLKRMKAGEFKSVRAAAVEAGIVKVPTPYQSAVKAVAKLSKAEKRRLFKALSEELGD